MDAPRDFLIFYFLIFIFSPNEQRAGGGVVRCQTFSFSFFPCSADHERDWPPCKVVFFGLATNALNVRNNNNNNNNLQEGHFIFICFAPLHVHPCPCNVRISTEHLYSEHAFKVRWMHSHPTAGKINPNHAPKSLCCCSTVQERLRSV